MVGMFLPRLEEQACVVVDPAEAPDQLAAALHAVAADDGLHLPTQFLAWFMHRTVRRPGTRGGRMPSVVELAVSCGVSLDLTNREIGEALHLSEATVKTHLHRLMTRMGLASRVDVACLMRARLNRIASSGEPDRARLAVGI